MVDREEVAPTFTKKPSIREEDDGNKLIFECQLNANPRPEVQWFCGDLLVKEDLRVFSRVKEFEPNKYLVSLEVNDVIESDSGLYKVVAKNKRGQVHASIQLNWTAKDDMDTDRQVDGIAPTFEKKPSIKQEDDGRILYFECIIKADPKPQVAWYHNGALIIEKGRFKVSLIPPFLTSYYDMTLSEWIL